MSPPFTATRFLELYLVGSTSWLCHYLWDHPKRSSDLVANSDPDDSVPPRCASIDTGGS